MIFGYTGCTLAEGRAPRGRDPSADSAAGIRRGRAQLAPRWTSNPGDNALNPGVWGPNPQFINAPFLALPAVRSGAIQSGHPVRPEDAEAVQGPRSEERRVGPFFRGIPQCQIQQFHGGVFVRE